MSKLQIIFGITFLIVAVASYESIQVNICDCEKDETFTKIGNNRYLIIEQKVNWFEASNICRANNADLANIHSTEELQALSQYLVEKGKTANDWFWIDGNDLAKEGTFYSSTTGLPMIFTKWSPEQPDNHGSGEHCVHLWLKLGMFLMNDCDCSQTSYAICKARKNSAVTVNTW